MRFAATRSIFCPYLLPTADTLPGRFPCQEEVCTRGGSCPGWPYLEQRGQTSRRHENQGQRKERREREKKKINK